jgi:hypothetical protein
MPPSIFEPFTLKSPTIFDVDFESIDSYFIASLLLLAYNQTQHRILSIFHFLHLPQNLTFEWWSQVYMRLHWTGDESWMFEIIAIISSWSWLHILVMQIVSKLVGTFLVKSSATTQAHSAVPELRFFTCQCTCAIINSWRWDGITNEVLVERLYRTVLCIVFILNSNVYSICIRIFFNVRIYDL